MLFDAFVLKVVVGKLNVFENFFDRPMRLLPHGLRQLVRLVLLYFLRDELILKPSPILLEILNDLIDILMKDPGQFAVVLIKIRKHVDLVRKLVLLVEAFEVLCILMVGNLILEQAYRRVVVAVVHFLNELRVMWALIAVGVQKGGS